MGSLRLASEWHSILMATPQIRHTLHVLRLREHVQRGDALQNVAGIAQPL